MPRITAIGLSLGRVRIQASMRPGQNAPDNFERLVLIYSGSVGFNEAGAKCPG